MKDLSLILPYVLPDAPSCAAPLALQKIRLAAIEFCKRTSVLGELVTLTTVADQTTYSLALADHAAFKIRSLRIDGAAIDLPERADLHERLSRGGNEQFAWLDGDNLLLNVAPVLAGQEMIISLVRIPSGAFQTVADVLVDEHAEAIGFGALARLHGMSKKDWSDPEAELKRDAQFSGEISKLASRLSRASTTTRRRAKAHFF
jgi:hypothetical protein